MADQRSYDALKRLNRNAAKLLTGTAGAAVLRLLSFVLIARALSPEQFGMLVLTYTYGAAVARLIAFQTWQAIIKYGADYETNNDRLKLNGIFRFGFLLDISTSIVAALVVYFGAELVATVLNWDATITDSVQKYSIAVLFSIEGVWIAALRLYNRFKWIAAYQIGAASIKLIAVLVIVKFEPSYNAFLWLWICTSIIEHLLLLMLGMVTLSQRRVRLGPDGAGWLSRTFTKERIKFSTTTNFTGMLTAAREMDTQIVALFLDEASAGIWRIARRIGALCGRLVDAFFDAIYPELTRMHSDHALLEMNQLVNQASWRVALLSGFATLTFVVVGTNLIGLTFGPEYSHAYHATIWILCAMTIWGFAQAFASGIVAFGAVGSSFWILFASTILYFTLIVLLTPYQGVLGTAIAFALFYAMWASLTYARYRQLHRQQILNLPSHQSRSVQ